MNSSLPQAVLDVLMQRVLQETSAAWLLIAADDTLKDCGGKLSTFGLEKLKPGCLVEKQAIFLEGILSAETPSIIDCVELDNGEYADIYLVTEGLLRWLILLGRTETSRWKGVAQQRANELKLLQQRLNMPSKNTNKIDFGNLMGMLALEQNDDGSFRLLEPIPGCAEKIYPETRNQYHNLHPEQDFPFLAYFMEDCERLWQANENNRLRSGPWIETSIDGEEYALEATAVLWQQRKILLIERLDGTYSEHHAVLQQGRENLLIKQKLEKELVRQKLMEQSLVEARAFAEHANQAKSLFLSSMSHELRTPLNAILGFAQLLLIDPENPLNDKQKENVDLIYSAGKHLLELIGQVLDLSRIEAGEMDMSLEDVLVADVIQAVMPMVMVLADKKQIKLTAQGDFDCLVRADFTRLKQVMLNLISNAIKYNNSGGSVEVCGVRTDNNRYRILVNDNGMGIPADKHHKLFKAFSRLGKEHSEIEGSGVGLAVTKTMVELMNGHIGFESTEGQGSTFWVEVPLAVEFDPEVDYSISELSP